MKRLNLVRTSVVIAVAVMLTLAGFFAGQASAYQGHMWSAMNHLNIALSQLQAAVPDNGGHRVNAINLVNQAIGEVKAGITAGAR